MTLDVRRCAPGVAAFDSSHTLSHRGTYHARRQVLEPRRSESVVECMCSVCTGRIAAVTAVRYIHKYRSDVCVCLVCTGRIAIALTTDHYTPHISRTECNECAPDALFTQTHLIRYTHYSVFGVHRTHCGDRNELLRISLVKYSRVGV